jgi:hypothetical protein
MGPTDHICDVTSFCDILRIKTCTGTADLLHVDGVVIFETVIYF